MSNQSIDEISMKIERVEDESCALRTKIQELVYTVNRLSKTQKIKFNAKLRKSKRRIQRHSLKA